MFKIRARLILTRDDGTGLLWVALTKSDIATTSGHFILWLTGSGDSSHHGKTSGRFPQIPPYYTFVIRKGFVVIRTETRLHMSHCLSPRFIDVATSSVARKDSLHVEPPTPQFIMGSNTSSDLFISNNPSYQMIPATIWDDGRVLIRRYRDKCILPMSHLAIFQNKA